MRRMALILISLCFLVGCSTSKVPKNTLSGTLTYKGRPVNGGALVLFSSDYEATVPLDQDGTFRSADIPPGDYKVMIEPSEGVAGPPTTEGMNPAMKEKFESAIKSQPPPTIPIPEKYKRKETTNLTVTVNNSRETKVNLELKD